MTTKERFIERAMNCCPTPEEWRRKVEQAINCGCLPSFDDMEDNYTDVYPLAGAILERMADECIYGSSYEKVRRKCRRQANNIKHFV